MIQDLNSGTLGEAHASSLHPGGERMSGDDQSNSAGIARAEALR